MSALTQKPVKVTMTGPHVLSKVAFDEHYDDLGKIMTGVGKLLRYNFTMLAEPGCRHIQIDEPLFTMSDEKEVRAAVETTNMMIEGLPHEVHV